MRGQGFPRRSPTGIYDPGILCGECDNGRLGGLDGYAQELLMHPLEAKVPMESWSATRIYEHADFDYSRLKLFFVSLMWRAHLSHNQFFRSVDLGPWQSEARRMIWESDPGTAHQLGVILFRYFVLNPEYTEVTHALPSPVRLRHKGLNGYVFRFADYSALIKVDSRPFPDGICELAISPERPLRIVLRDYLRSREFKSAGAWATEWEDFVGSRGDAT